MAKRFRDTGRWSGWYRSLPWRAKILWEYMTDQADTAGVWKPDFELASFQTNAPAGQAFTEKDLEIFGEAIELLPGGLIFLRPFITDQYTTLKIVKGKPSKICVGVVKKLKEHGLRQDSIDRLLIPYIESIDTSQDQDHDQDQDQDQGERGAGENHEPPAPARPSEPAASEEENRAAAHQEAEAALDFEALWRKYPEGQKGEARKRFDKYICSSKAYAELERAVDNYLADCKARQRYLKDFSTFIGSNRSGHPWREWVERAPAQPSAASAGAGGSPALKETIDRVCAAVLRFGRGAHMNRHEYEAHRAKIAEAVGPAGVELIRRAGGWSKVHELAARGDFALRSRLADLGKHQQAAA